MRLWRLRRWAAMVLPAMLAVGCSSARAAVSPAQFALVELFTSEGCSSCPPADRVLANITREAERQTRPVYTLAFHVDYWDSLGFRDRFSAAWASRRQQVYAAHWGLRPYTPQLVIDGRQQLIGSRAAQIRAGLAQALARPRSLRLQLRVASDARASRVSYRLSAKPVRASVLNVALVQDTATVAVDAGENAGRVLHHVHVVRAFASVPLDAARGSVVLPWPSALSPADAARLAWVGYVQQAQTLAIDAAARAVLR